MLELKLAPKNLGQAATAAHGAWDGFQWANTTGDSRGAWLCAVIAAAPFLQVPIAPITDEEAREIVTVFPGVTPGGITTTRLKLAIQRMIDSRNSPQLWPERRQRLIRRLSQCLGSDNHPRAGELADIALNVLDEVHQ